jgi:AAA domain
MPVLKKTDALPERPVVILIYGEPGIGKTSLFNTSPNPLLIDFDRGKDRAIYRQDTVVVNTWEDVEAEEKAGTFKEYSTIGVDTAKSALDDFLMGYVVKKDFKNAKNKLAAYGAIGDEFKIFISNRRSEAADIVIIAHSKDDKDGDITKKMPDVTGGSYQLLLRIADQVGYMSMQNNKRTLLFEPTDRTIGKNVARLPLVQIPDETEAAFKTFMGEIISKTKKAICAQSEAQNEALKKVDEYSKLIAACKEPAELTKLIKPIQELGKPMSAGLLKEMGDFAKGKGYEFDKATGAWQVPEPVDVIADDEQTGELNF